MGVEIGDIHFSFNSILFYPDDMVTIAPCEAQLQYLFCK